MKTNIVPLVEVLVLLASVPGITAQSKPESLNVKAVDYKHGPEAVSKAQMALQVLSYLRVMRGHV